MSSRKNENKGKLIITNSGLDFITHIRQQINQKNKKNKDDRFKIAKDKREAEYDLNSLQTQNFGRGFRTQRITALNLNQGIKGLKSLSKSSKTLEFIKKLKQSVKGKDKKSIKRYLRNSMAECGLSNENIQKIIKSSNLDNIGLIGSRNNNMPNNNNPRKRKRLVIFNQDVRNKMKDFMNRTKREVLDSRERRRRQRSQEVIYKRDKTLRRIKVLAEKKVDRKSELSSGLKEWIRSQDKTLYTNNDGLKSGSNGKLNRSLKWSQLTKPNFFAKKRSALNSLLRSRPRIRRKNRSLHTNFDNKRGIRSSSLDDNIGLESFFSKKSSYIIK